MLLFSKGVKKVKFAYYFLSDLHIKVNLPIVVRTDNIGAILKSENTLPAHTLDTWIGCNKIQIFETASC
jgi:hypothetical protein